MRAVLLLCAAAVLAGCGQNPRVTALSDTAATIVADYRALAAAADSLQSAAGGFCEAPDRQGLRAAREAWDATMAAWMRVQPVRFGPVRQASRDYRMQFWPDPRDLVASQTRALIDGDGAIDADRVSAGSVAVQGLPAVEYLLYPDDGDALPAFESEVRRCAMLRAVTAAVAATTAELARAWSPEGGGYATALTEYGEEAVFADAEAALAAVVGSLAETVQDMNASKLAWPLGARSEGEPQPLRVESRRSGRSLANIRDNLAGIETLFTADGRGGIAALLRTRHGEAGRALADETLAALARAESLAGSLETPFYQALQKREGLDGYRELLTATRELGDLLGERLPKQLDVPLGFNFNDGD
ncbi:periplasmic lipoprotein-like protein [Salinisphaera sp. PC39]|uniref:imelysin family protein n=1 Tax=Salinisphaera sp. PC39 TaxID=1304156 RepID=UPI00333F4BF8